MKRFADRANTHLANISIGIAVLGNLLLLAISVEANYGYSLGVSDVSPYIRLAITGALALVVLSRPIEMMRFVTDPFVFCMAAYICVGAGIGLFSNGLTYEFIRHGFAAITIIVAYLAGRASAAEIRDSNQSLIAWGWITAIFGVATFIACIPAMTYVAYSLSPAPLLFALDAGIASKSIALMALAGAIIALGNKRGVILAACAIIATALVRKWFPRAGLLPRLLVGFALTIGLTFATLYTIKVASSSATLAMWGEALPLPAFDRASRVIDALGGQAEMNSEQSGEAKPHEMTALDRFSSGRVSQLWGVLDEIDGSISTIIFGGGFGSSFTWSYWSDNLDALQQSRQFQVDFMPLWFLLTGGITFAIAIPSIIAWRLIQIYGTASSAGLGVGALFALGFSIDALLSFQPNAPLFWLFLGAFSLPPRRA